MSADPFSDILKLTNAETIVTGSFTAGGSWAIRFAPHDKIKFGALLKGSCWLRVDGAAEPVLVEAGDVLLLSGLRAFVLASDPAAVPVDAASVFGGLTSGAVQLGAGDDCIQIGGYVRLDPVSGGLLADVLPPLIHVRAGTPQAAVLHWLLDQLVRERRADRPGARLAAGQIAQLMFVHILRAHLDMSAEAATGWLRALGDPRLAPALRLMHGEPGRAWQLGELAREAAMSRSSFALHFKTVAGVPPLAYLAAWRMRLAERALREEATPIAGIAGRLGYTSESTFSNAFKRATGEAPKRYRGRERRGEAAAAS